MSPRQEAEAPAKGGEGKLEEQWVTTSGQPRGLSLSWEVTQAAALDFRARWEQAAQVGVDALVPPSNGLTLVLTHPASSPSPDGQDSRRPRSRNPSTWTVEDVVWFVKDADPQALGPHVELFRKHVCVWWARTRRRRGGRRPRRRVGWVWGRGVGSELSLGGTTQGGQLEPQASQSTTTTQFVLKG